MKSNLFEDVKQNLLRRVHAALTAVHTALCFLPNILDVVHEVVLEPSRGLPLN